MSDYINLSHEVYIVMCGIFGIQITNSFTRRQALKPLIKDLFLLSESRGKEASGIAVRSKESLKYIRCPFTAAELIKTNQYQNLIRESVGKFENAFSLIGHSRLVTNGYEHDNRNNQPVVRDNIAVVHNGIIVNHAKLWEKYSGLNRNTDLDSELIPTLINNQLKLGGNLPDALHYLFSEIQGMTSIASLFAERAGLLLATNNGSLYYLSNTSNDFFCFASEADILKQLVLKNSGIGLLEQNIQQVEAGVWLSINQSNFITKGKLEKPGGSREEILPKNGVVRIDEIIGVNAKQVIPRNRSLEHIVAPVPKIFENEFHDRQIRIASIKRCTRCILPASFPFIYFDDAGVCNYCQTHYLKEYRGLEALKEKINLLTQKNKKGPNCLVPFSGGRDSSYVLHYTVKELGLKPLAFSYDWGMLTDLSRRNQSRMCGSLGIEHILVSADIRKKRNNIRKNVLAWLKRPQLGTIPLFMAGDKQYFYHNNKILRSYNLHLSVMGENPLEKTGFKTMFSGAKQTSKGFMAYHISDFQKIKMLAYYGKEYMLNPAYINKSLVDTLGAFFSYYGIKHDYINLFDYVPWDEKTVEDTILNGYDWETDPGTRTTWRIGDGTAAFYNYIYYMVAGFTENDTFRSNQIREGMISRDEALRKANTENLPRWDSIQWYCNVIQIDWERAIQRINTIKPLFQI